MFFRAAASVAVAFAAIGPVMAASSLVEGKFGKALDAQVATLAAPARSAYSSPPITVELWARLRTKAVPHVLVASEAKESGTHWELFTFTNEGHFSAYLPGYAPAVIASEADIADRRWHQLAMTFDGRTVRLYVDAKEVAAQSVERNGARPSRPGPLTIGTVQALTKEPLVIGGLGCSCELDDVRISKGVLPITDVPSAPLRVQPNTLALWSMDRLIGETVPNVLPAGAPARLSFRKSLDDIERAEYNAAPAPMSYTPVTVTLAAGRASHPAAVPAVSLDGTWQMAEGGSEQERLSGPWADAIPAAVPGSVHGALTRAGRIPDPKFGLNDKIAHDKSFSTWWLRTTFPRPSRARAERLVFDGVAIRGTVWLNGKRLGTHEGMFGGPEFSITGLLKDNNELIVKLDPAPGKKERWSNNDWRRTVVFNNVWGWHYSAIPALGIWRSVRVEATPAVRIVDPFFATKDVQAGLVDLSLQLAGPAAAWSGQLTVTIEPDNFAGAPYHFTSPVSSTAAVHRVRLRFRVPDPKLWWPNDIGEQNLYKATLSFAPDSGAPGDRAERLFGIRTVEMRPQADGPRPDHYNWTFVINGRPMFVKGSNWCTMDSSMDFSRERYDRFLSVAKMQHVELLRAWGSGMPETDDFYDLCDRKGIMVLQEWPTAWDSHNDQPYDMLEETVRLNTLRIRNHPSLVMYAGGNESPHPFGPAIDMMGRYAIELDGTRAFHRGEPWGGSQHKYDPWWGYAHLDFYLNATAPFWGEFGLASLPLYESIQRYLPDDEKDAWPPKPDGALLHHTPIFNTANDWGRLQKQAGYFTAGATLAEFARATQVAQATGVRHALERARTMWPHSAGALYYKINDNYPAASWSTADWYGAMKLSHFVIQDAFNPLLACALFSTANSNGQPVFIPIYLVDDLNELKDIEWNVLARVYDSNLRLIKQDTFSGAGSIDAVKRLGVVSLTEDQTQTAPLLTVVDIRKAGALAQRVFYWTNYEAKKDSLFSLPETRLSMQTEGNDVTVTNAGTLPAVAVHVDRPGHMDTFTASDGYFWLDPGESHRIRVNDASGLSVSAWNVPSGPNSAVAMSSR